MNRLLEIQNLIDKANHTYYTQGQDIMEDARYDGLITELRILNPTDPRLRTIGSVVRDSVLQKRKHTIPMGSQEKALNKEEFDQWVETNIGDFQAALHASYKADGGSCSLEYLQGKLVCAVTRGDGIEGEDITANAMRFKNLPDTVTLPNGQLFSGFVRAEIVLDNEGWEIADPEQTSNPRSLAVGIARRKSGEESDLNQILAFRIFDTDGHPLGETEEEQSALLKKLGFTPTPSMVGNAEEVWAWREIVVKQRPNLDYWIDGIVVKLNHIGEQLAKGQTDNRPKGQVAIKFEAQGGQTILRSVTMSTGHTGAIVPTAEFDSVPIGGSNITSATLANFDVIATLDVAIGDTIFVIKAGDIIPRITEVLSRPAGRQPIQRPTCCPACQGPVGHTENVSGEQSSHIYCLTDSCPGKKSGKIRRYLSSLKILGSGDSLLNAIVTQLNVTDAADLYTLKNQRDALANLKLNGKVRFGEKRADKFIAEIDAQKELTLPQFLGSLGCSGLGKRRVALIQQAVPGQMDTLEDWLSGKLVTLATQAKVPNLAKRIQTDLSNTESVIRKCLTNGVTIKTAEPAAQSRPGAFTFCITGALSEPKEVFAAMIRQAGHNYTDSFSKSVTHLIAADPNSGSSKLTKAAKAGTHILSEQDLRDLLQQPI